MVVRRLFPFAVAVLVAWGVLALRAVAVQTRPPSVDAVLAAPALPADVLGVLALGFDSAAADVNYLAAIQIFGDRIPRGATRDYVIKRSLAISRLVDMTTDLDPLFNYAYIFGAVVIPLPNGDGTAENVAPTLALLEKGVRTAGPDWRIPFHLAYLNSTYTGDFQRAATAMAEAARRPGHPEYLPLLATKLAAEGGDIETGIDVAQAMLASAETDEAREEYEDRIRLLYMERDLRQIEKAARGFHDREGHYPSTVQELEQAGLLSPGLEEPHGGEYLIDPDTGVARSSVAKRLRIAQPRH